VHNIGGGIYDFGPTVFVQGKITASQHFYVNLQYLDLYEFKSLIIYAKNKTQLSAGNQ